MIILEKPYVSEFLQQSVIEMKVPVLKTDFVLSLPLAHRMNLIDKDTFLQNLTHSPECKIYSNSENSSVWLNQHAEHLQITQLVNKLKDKALFRELFSNNSPDFWYKTYTVDQIFGLDIRQLPNPFVLKPKRGFASICIYAIFTDSDWTNALQSIKKEIEEMQNVFPDKVVSLSEFIIEKYVGGKELAVDAYFDNEGNPVILNILTHLHTSNYDMSDRLYITSSEMIQTYLLPMTHYLQSINKTLKIKNFPFHLEMKADENLHFFPIEINPMRFMGFCVADVEFLFYGINPYSYFFENKIPDWNKIFETRENKIYGLMVIDIPKSIDKQSITFNYDTFIAHFTKPLHYVKMDYTVFPMSIFMFAEVEKHNFAEFQYILDSDIMEFINI